MLEVRVANERKRLELIDAELPTDTTPLAQLAEDVRRGLTDPRKRLSCRYFYDAEGSRLFEEICTLDEYYPPRCEREILERIAGEIAALWPEGGALVELGSGNAAKTRILIDAISKKQGRLRYVPVDVSRTMLEESSRALLDEYPALDVLAIAGEYEPGMRTWSEHVRGPKLVLWLGSNIGNFGRDEAAAFLRGVGAHLSPGDRILVGVDLRKDRAILVPAYDDARGVTAAFNKNILARINRDLGANFDLDRFRHRAVYDEQAGRIEMYLVSERDQRVRIDGLGLDVRFAAEEAIHTEDSYKYALEELDRLAADAGMRLERRWVDGRQWFAECLLAVGG